MPVQVYIYCWNIKTVPRIEFDLSFLTSDRSIRLAQCTPGKAQDYRSHQCHIYIFGQWHPYTDSESPSPSTDSSRSLEIISNITKVKKDFIICILIAKFSIGLEVWSRWPQGTFAIRTLGCVLIKKKLNIYKQTWIISSKRSSGNANLYLSLFVGFVVCECISRVFIGYDSRSL